MAMIVGLDEQQAALKRVKDNLKEVASINRDLASIKEYVAKAKTKEYNLACKFLFSDDSIKRIKVPLVIEDSDFIISALMKHKETIVKLIKDDAGKYHISLSPQEESSLLSENIAES